MLDMINNDLNTDVAIIYASNKIKRDEQEIDYSEDNEEYVLINDPIRRIADTKY